MSIIVTGSIAYDYLMCYPGHFLEHILLNDTGKISVSFLVEDKQLHRGGVGPNIAYSLALLGSHPRLMGTAGHDFVEFAAWLNAQGIDTSLVRIYPDEFTATFTVMTDLDQNQIAGFHAGAMSRARELSFRDLDRLGHRPGHHLAERPGRHGEVCAASAGSWRIPFIYDPSQQLARMDGSDIMRRHAGRQCDDRQRL